MRPVTVGVDGSPQSLAAHELAVREAARRSCPVRVVHAAGAGPPPAWLAALGGLVVAGSPAQVLLRESEDAALLVVGHRGHGGLSDLLVGSVAAKVAAHARCPVLIARGEPPATGEVVLGVDPEGCGEAAIGFAFEEAELRGAELVALHAWQGRATALDDMLPPVYLPSPVETREARLLADALAGWQAEYPRVRVRRRLVRAPAARTLVEASHWAQLVVIGAGATGLPFRSVKQALLDGAACPVAVVPPVDVAVTGAGPRPGRTRGAARRV